MWFIVNTDKFQEQKTKEFLENTYPGIVKFVYLPKCRTKYVNAQGEERFRFRPLIYGLLFIKADSIKVLKKILTPWGYFVYEDIIRSLETGELQKEKLVSSAHLLCKDVKNLSPDDIIRTATIPDEDMEHFIYGIKSSEKVKNNPISYNTTKIILVCGLFFVFLKLEL